MRGNPRDQRHEGEEAADHPNDERERFPQRGGGEREPRLLLVRSDRAGCSPNDDGQRTGNPGEQNERHETGEKARPGVVIDNAALPELRARILREAVDPLAVGEAGLEHFAPLGGRVFGGGGG